MGLGSSAVFAADALRLGIFGRYLGFRGWETGSRVSLHALSRKISFLTLHAFRFHGAGFRVQGSGFRVQGSGFRVRGSESGYRV